MKNIILIFSVLFSFFLEAQYRKKDYKDILKSNNIYEINAFLRDAHPNDPRRTVLKPRVMDMMEEYIRKALPFDQRVPQMQEMLAMLKQRPSTKISFEEFSNKIKEKHIAKVRKELEIARANRNTAPIDYKQYSSGNSGAAAVAAAAVAGIQNYTNTEEEEFNKLIALSPTEHKDKTVKILNSLFDNDPSSNEVIVMVENKSDCNIIVRMEAAGGKKYNLPVPSKQENSMVIEKGSYLFTSLVCGAQYASQKNIKKAIMVSLANPGAPK